MQQIKKLLNQIISDRKILVFGLFGFALLALPVTVILLQRQQDFRQLAAVPETLTLEPINDTYVDSSNPDKSYGTDTLLKVAGSPAKIALIKFDLSPLADKEITSAQLKLQMAESSASTFTLRAVEDSSWDDTITYKTQPLLGNAFATPGNSGGDLGKNIDITDKVKTKTGQLFSLGVTSTSRNALAFHSKESSGNKPALVVTYTTRITPSITILPTTPVTTTKSPTAPISDTLSPTTNPTPSGESCRSAKSDIVIMIDRSLSMSNEITQAKKAALLFVSKVASNPQTKLSLISFSNQTSVTPLTNDFEAISVAIKDIKNLEWGTCLQCAVDKANTEFATNGRSSLKKTVILLTDGKPTRTASGAAETPVAEAAALESVRSGLAQHNLTYYTIGVGGGVNADFLKEIAQKTSGKYYHSPTGDDLDDIYVNISTIIGKGAITGSVYNDENNNGQKNASESALSGWTLNIQDKYGSFNQKFISTASGEYLFSGLCEGKTYNISEMAQSGWRQTSPVNPDNYEITISDGKVYEANDFGNVKVTNCTDGVDNDSNGFTDRIDSSCHTDWNPKNPDSYNPDLDGEKGGIGESCADSKDNNKNNLIDGGDPICHTDGNADNAQSYDPNLSEFDPNADVLLNLSVFLHGIGKSGDNRNPSSDFSNKNPQRPERRSFIEVYNDQNQLTATTEAMITYASSSGSFVGTANIGVATSGNYTVKIKTEQHLKNQFTGIQKISAGRTIDLSPISLVTGDTNNDNRLDILDYNILYGCYTSDLMPTPRSCAGDNSTKADLDDEGKVNLFDLNLFIRELSVQSGA